MLRQRFLSVALVLVMGGLVLAAAEEAQSPSRDNAKKLFDQGNYNEAYNAYRKLALDKDTDPKQVGQDLHMGIQSLQNLGRVDENDAFREGVIDVHKTNWRLLQAAAHSYIQDQHFGFIIAGKFERGHRRGQGKFVSAMQRDRVRALQLMQQAYDLALADKNASKEEQAAVCFDFADMLLRGRYYEAWRLQYLTDLATLPDYEETYGYWYGWGGGGSQGAPVDVEGNPIYHKLPESYQKAASDGERWRSLLEQTAQLHAARRSEVDYHFASFLWQQFDVHTAAYYGRFFSEDDGDTGGENKPPKASAFSVRTLTEDETIARLATGVKRFKLPDEFNFIKIYRAIADRGKGPFGGQALDQLAQIFENRVQYPKAAQLWQRGLKEYGDQNHRQARIDQILKNWGRFENAQVQPAGQGATVEFRYRNGKKVSFEAHAINVTKLLADVKAYLKSSPPQLDWQKMDISNVGYRLVQQDQAAYIGEKVASWDLELKPRAEHLDRRVTVTTPLQKAGVYLLTARMEGGHVSRIIMWLDDTALVKKALHGKSYYFIADSITGQPIEKANVEYFGWKQVPIDQKRNQWRITTANFAEYSDKDGQVILGPERLPQDHQWMIVARTASGRLAYLGFTGAWYGQYYDYEYNQTKVFVMTDRPVYRPEQAAKFKYWVRHAKYDQADTSSFAKQQFRVQINDPMGEKVHEETATADEYGGIAGEIKLAKGCKLGVYSVQVFQGQNGLGGGSFRVEEYKKPEFEVTIEAPKEPVMLGEKIAAEIKSKYYFGAPVTKAKVKYKVLRSSHSQHWFPIARWDWFYGRGYWWYAYDYVWYPGWKEWGCFRPIWWWWGHAEPQPEVVMESEVPVGADGIVKVEIDTALAKELHGDTDHSYSITAEVVDESRRTIVGQGEVLVARHPFKVFAWVDRGHYRVGDTVTASFDAHTLDNKPVQGKGELKLLSITYNEKGVPQEKEVQNWKLDTDAQGHAQQQIKASEAGQYRLSYKLTDAKNHTIEGGYIFVVIGQGFDGSEFRFADIELITDKREYAPGEKVKLMVNTNRAGAAVVLFVRPANGIYLPPKVLRLKGKSAVEEIEVATKDMPNFFVEAFTIHGGKLHNEMREVIVPPEKRVIDVAVTPSQTEYLPGAPAKVQIKLTGADGKPFEGSTVVSVYDKSVEYISGGTNVPEIREFFWKWRRTHYPQRECSLDRWFYNLLKSGEIGMSDLGVFGGQVAEELEKSFEGADKPGQQAASAAPGGPAGGYAKRGQGRSNLRQANGLANRKESKDEGGPAAPPPPPAGQVQPAVRKSFADTAFWAASVTTDKNGMAEVALTMPENLTGWKVKCWAMGHGTKVGQGEAEVVTRKNIIVRLQAPRFFVEKDEVVLSANVHNYLKTDKKTDVVLELEGSTLAPMGDLAANVNIPAGSELRVDWRVKVTKEGEALVRMKALTDEESDAMEMKFPVFVHGMLKTESFSGVIRPDKELASVAFTVPSERRINQTRLEVRYSPTLAGAMVDALPYMVEYPYGCTEQTLNRFLPTVVTHNVLKRMNLDLKAIQEKRTNLNAQEIGDDKERAKAWKRFDRNPVFDADEVLRMVKEGVDALTSMQCSDGGWGWFSGWGEHSWPHTTAIVVHGLQIAKANDVALVPGTLENGVEWLKRYQAQELVKIKNAPTMTQPWKPNADSLDALVYMVLVDAGHNDAEMMEFLYRDRTKISVYAKAMFGLALHNVDQIEKRDMILRNIEQYLVQDDENQTAFLRLPPGSFWWYWFDDEIESNAYYLKLLTKVNPKDERCSRLVKYLLNNRKHATYWNSTRDTSLCIEAFAEYIQASGEDKPDMTVQIVLDGKPLKEVKITPQDLFTFDNKFVLEGDAVESGPHKLEVKRTGKGPVYFNAYLTNFTLEDFITKAGLEVRVNRKYYKLTRVDKTEKVAGSRGQALDQKVEKYERSEISNLGTLKSGDLVQIELEIDSKNDYEYLIFEDMKGAGFEPVDVRSGYTGNEMGAYVEFRDEKVSFFVRALARGKSSVSYRVRAEIPGRFSALPTRAYAMYAPELKGNSDEIKVRIED
ncbi:MAG: alpha-2-macroglobulin [Planctomycetia bacterium]|nr:alpha-2-macroglobulin [Planctomycetia bacterium]